MTTPKTTPPVKAPHELPWLLLVFAVFCMVVQALNWRVSGDPQFWWYLGWASALASVAAGKVT